MPHLEPLTLPAGYPVAITPEQWQTYIAPELTDLRGELETYGPWGLPVRFRAPAVTVTWADTGWAQMETITLWGPRTLGKLRESGYQLEGRVSIGGRTTTGFTSSQMFRLPDGTLLEAAVIHCRKPQP